MNKSSFSLLQIIFIDDTNMCVYYKHFQVSVHLFHSNIYILCTLHEVQKKNKYIHKDVEFLKVGLFLIKNTFQSLNFCGKTNQIKNLHVTMQKQYLNKAYI